MCKSLLKKYKDQLTDGLQNGDEAGDICTSIRLCKEPPGPLQAGADNPRTAALPALGHQLGSGSLASLLLDIVG
ncbi:hypothetical protein UY3_14352 [Chelonia mydas]|uniref:Saposin B-type domain-containing protein n=1 Tax=Chelonia mydas TaxID=8469 RepID=M7AZK6_CHEMY|nr:hypothetical protein UY3_14352 [Chelonia mydas]